MKLTKIHIFLILLLALVLCSTLGICYNEVSEGFSNRDGDKRNYKSYSDYNTQKNDDNIRSVNHSDNKSSNYKNPFFNKANWRLDKDEDDLNGGNNNDRSRMRTNKQKYSKLRDDVDDRNSNPNVSTIGIFESVAKGKMNGPMYNVKETVTKQDNGVSRSKIPPGQEDLYILKSEIVPPICPACPSMKCNNSSTDAKKCPPCPPCARCPEPSFECKKVPNYNSKGLMNQLPIPWADKL
jgi:hypothetical protein